MQPSEATRTPLTPQQQQVVDRAKRYIPPRSGPPAHSPAWERETNKCIGREVTVTQYVGMDGSVPIFIEHRGVCVAIQQQHLSVILMTEIEKVIIKNVGTIRRVRAKNSAPPSPEKRTDAQGSNA